MPAEDGDPRDVVKSECIQEELEDTKGATRTRISKKNNQNPYIEEEQPEPVYPRRIDNTI